MNKLYITLLFFLILNSACNSKNTAVDDVDRKIEELGFVPIFEEYPNLLPEGLSQPLSVNNIDVGNGIDEYEFTTITNIISRVPGYFNRHVRYIGRSVDDADLVEVYVYPYIFKFKKMKLYYITTYSE